MSGLSSMTGFGVARGDADWGRWSVEAKSVNGRGLDVRVNTPPGFDALEPTIRHAAKARFSRGSLQVSVRVEPAEAGDQLDVNRAALDTLLDASQQMRPDLRWLRSRRVLSSHALATLMTIKGVVTPRGGHDVRSLAEATSALDDVSRGVETALDALHTSRAEEGQTVETALRARVGEMRKSLDGALAAAASAPLDLKARLIDRLGELNGLEGLAPGRLEAEVALLATKADVREELDRLAAHLDRADQLIGEGSPAGRPLDFLAQEIGREANTLCSKSTSLDLTNAGLALKTSLDQFKEQLANVE